MLGTIQHLYRFYILVLLQGVGDEDSLAENDRHLFKIILLVATRLEDIFNVRGGISVLFSNSLLFGGSFEFMTMSHRFLFNPPRLLPALIYTYTKKSCQAKLYSQD
jgi:hypothetical protein